MVNRSRRTQAVSLPAPVKGLNDRDSIADMDADYALTLDNMFPMTRSVVARGGSVLHASGLPATGETLMTYQGIYSSSEVNKLFVAAGGDIYDATAGGVLGLPVVTGKTNARWDCVNFANSGASFLVAVNGQDLPMFYNGNAWAASGSGYATAITGVTASTFTQVSAWKNRLFFVQKNSLSCWYLPTGAIGGAAALLNFGGVAKLGGKLIATGTITTSAGLTLDDYFVAITSEGECLVYRGTDPDVPGNFVLVGNYRIGRPIANGDDNQGGRFLCKFAADMVAITADGFTTLQGMFNADVKAQKRTINDAIVNMVTQSVTTYRNNFGWQIMLCPMQNKLIINVPTAEGLQAIQYVMNTITGAWTRFTGWNVTHFAYFQDKIYGIEGGNVYTYDEIGANDRASSTSTGEPIFAMVKTAFAYPGGRGQQKKYHFCRPLIMVAGDMSPAVNINVNLGDEPIDGAADMDTGGGDYGVWDYSEWQPSGTPAKWAPDINLFQEWLSVNGIGYSVALKMNIVIDRNKLEWQGWDLQFERGGLI